LKFMLPDFGCIYCNLDRANDSEFLHKSLLVFPSAVHPNPLFGMTEQQSFESGVVGPGI